MLPLSDEMSLISRSDIVVAAMIQYVEEMDAMIGTAKKSEAEIQTIFRSPKMSSTEGEKKTERRLVPEVQHHQAKETDLLTLEDVCLKITRLK